MKTPEELWQVYWTAIAPPEVDEIQEKETRQAFFAGAYSTVVELIHNSAQKEEDSVRSLDGFLSAVRGIMIAEFVPSSGVTQ